MRGPAVALLVLLSVCLFSQTVFRPPTTPTPLVPGVKGDILAFGTAWTAFTGGTDGQVLTKDSTTATGLKWAAAAGGGTWGSITGTLSDQTDLDSALDGKAAASHSHAAADVTSGTLSSGLLPYPGSSAKGAILTTSCPSGQYVTGYDSSGAPVCGTPSGGTEYVLFRALCQNTVAGPNLSTPSANAPTFTCVSGANAGDVSATASATNYGVLSFAENATEATSQSIQVMLYLPSTWASAAGIDLIPTWRAAQTTGDLLLRAQGACVADGEVPGSFSAATNFTASTAKATTLQWNTVATKTLTTSDALAGCAAGETLILRVWRDATQAGDTLSGAAELVSLVAKLTR